MTYRSDDLRHDDCMHKGCKLKRDPDLEWIRKCFPRSIMPSDVDGMVEINGQFLFIEHKGPGDSFEGSEGQRRALKRLGQQPNVTVLVLRERTDGGFDQLVFEPGQESEGFQVRTRAQVVAWIQDWAFLADWCGPGAA